jgi:Subtilase family
MRQYLTLTTDKALLDVYGDFVALRGWTLKILDDLGAPRALLDLLNGVEVVSAPSTNLRWAIPGDDRQPSPDELVVSCLFPDTDAIDRLREFLVAHLGELSGGLDKDATVQVRNIGADPRAHLCAFFPAAPARPFGDRSRVREMMGVAELRAAGLTGRGVHVVILDQGVNRQAIEARHPYSWGGGLAVADSVEPGEAPRTSHGTMIARNILDLAPDARIYDVPMIPPRIARPDLFASSAHATYKAVLEKIRQFKDSAGANAACVLVNAWGIYDRSVEYPEGDYTRNTHYTMEKPAPGTLVWKPGHPLNRIMKTATDEGIDVVFGAGNCGQFTTSGRCGRHDRGEGRSIWGANAHPAVLTVGAVSANAEWLGYSSQGPAPWGGAQKPDICTPSHFSEDDDPSRVNSGTSASTGLAAGVVAAVRGNSAWGPDNLSPAELKEKINAAARGPNGEWNSRTGNGMLNAGALLRELASPASA